MRDATGNVLALYEGKANGLHVTPETIVLKETIIYGSSRIGQYRGFKNDAAQGEFNKKTALGQRIYEFSNHLGNVLVTLTDHKLPQTEGGYKSFVLSASDYYPFGLAMTERTYQNGEYRFGFNGQEQSDELDENGNSYTAEFWQYDARIARRWNVDPVVIPFVSGYATFLDNPIYWNDLNGDKVGDCEACDENANYAVGATVSQNGKTWQNMGNGEWLDISNNKGSYQYTEADIQQRNKIINLRRIDIFLGLFGEAPLNPVAVALRRNESAGIYEPLTTPGWYRAYVNKFQTNSSIYFGAKVTAEILDEGAIEIGVANKLANKATRYFQGLKKNMDNMGGIR